MRADKGRRKKMGGGTKGEKRFNLSPSFAQFWNLL